MKTEEKMFENARFIVYSGPNTTFIMLMKSNVPHLNMAFLFICEYSEQYAQ